MTKYLIAALIVVSVSALTINVSAQEGGGTAPAPESTPDTEAQIDALMQAYADGIGKYVNARISESMDNMREQMFRAGIDQQDLIVNRLAEAAWNHQALIDRTDVLLKALDEKGLDAKALGLEPVAAVSAMPVCSWIRTPSYDMGLCPVGTAP